MIRMLPLCCEHPTFPGITSIPSAMIPAMPFVPLPSAVYPSTAMADEDNSGLYGRFRHVRRDHPGYRHVPFDWYLPPKQQYNVIREDVAVMTLDGPVPIDDFHRYYVYNGEMDDSTDDESSYEEERIDYRRQCESESDSDDEEAESYLQLARSYNSPLRSSFPSTRNLMIPDDFIDPALVNSTSSN